MASRPQLGKAAGRPQRMGPPCAWGGTGEGGSGSQRPAPLPGMRPGEVTRAPAPPPSPSQCGCDIEHRNERRVGADAPLTWAHLRVQDGPVHGTHGYTTPNTTLHQRDAVQGGFSGHPAGRQGTDCPHCSVTSVQEVVGGWLKAMSHPQGHTRSLMVCHLLWDVRKPRDCLHLPAECHLSLGGPQGRGPVPRPGT